MGTEPFNRCAGCGFLAIQDTAQRKVTPYDFPFLMEPVYAEAPRRTRESGLLSVGRGFTCFMDEPQWVESTRTLKKPSTSPSTTSEDYSDVLSKERICPSFRKYIIGFNPKEHLQMRIDEYLREEQRKERRGERRFRALEVLAFVLAGVLTAIVGAMVERGTLFGGEQGTGGPQSVIVVTATPPPTVTPIPPSPTPDSEVGSLQEVP